MTVGFIEEHEITDGVGLCKMSAVHCNGKVILIGYDYGITLFITEELYQQIENDDISDDLLFKLIQHGLAYAPEKNEILYPSKDVCPSFFILELTNKCNFGCTYCFRDHAAAHESFANADSIDRTVKVISEYCRKRGKHSVNVQPWGGEPLLNLDGIVRIYEDFAKENIKCNITIMTNASLITEKTAETLRRINADVGISIDGPEFIHNEQRPYYNGKASFSDTVRGIENLKKAGFAGSLGTISVITKKSVHKVSEIIRYIALELGISSIKLNIVRSSPDVSLSENEIALYCKSMLQTLIELYNEGHTVVEGNVRNRLMNLIDRSNTNICDSFGCCGGYKMISVDMNGNIFPCERTDDVSQKFGSICDGKDIQDIVQDALKKHPYFTKKYSPECDNCPWWSYCQGGCTTAAQYYGSEKGCVDKLTCTLNRTLYPMLAELLLTQPDVAEILVGGKSDR